MIGQHEYCEIEPDGVLRQHLVTVHDIPADLALRLSHTGLIVIHVGAHESADHE